MVDKINEKSVDNVHVILYNLSADAVKNIIAKKLERAKQHYDAHASIRNQEKVIKQYYLD